MKQAILSRTVRVLNSEHIRYPQDVVQKYTGCPIF